ncbi:MAG: hypothetical protein LBJ14_10685 [Desulfarculales bacterium]|jgi:hypothetical protein|nr:hypothetical protein [Desulfarculales bacterium]
MNIYSNQNPQFKNAVKDFMNIGTERNKLVHRNLVASRIEWTLDEIYNKAISANNFIETLRCRLIEDHLPQ